MSNRHPKVRGSILVFFSGWGDGGGEGGEGSGKLTLIVSGFLLEANGTFLEIPEVFGPEEPFVKI